MVVVELHEDVDLDDVDRLCRALEDRLGDLGVSASVRWED